MAEDNNKNTGEEAGSPKVSEQIKQQLSIPIPANHGTIQWLDTEKYPINFNLKFEEWSTEKADAFDVSDRHYALVFSRNFSPPLGNISTIAASNCPNVQKVYTYGKVKHTNKMEEFFVVILEKIRGIPLAEMIEAEGRFTEKKIAEYKILLQLLIALKMLHEEEIVYGILCTNNIYWDADSHRIVLRENFSHYQGYLQDPQYESIDSILVDKTAKSFVRYSDDFYALGVVMFSLIIGGKPYRGSIARELLGNIRLENGSLEAMISFTRTHKKLFLSAHLEDILRGLLVDSVKERWGLREVERWRNRLDNALPVLNHHKESMIPFVFDDIEYHSQRALANALFRNWNNAKKLLKLADLSRWLGVTLKRTDLAEKIDNLASSRDNNVIYTDERICKVILILDPSGPLRFRGISVDLEGLGTFYTDIYYKQDQELLRQFSRLFNEGLLAFAMRERGCSDNILCCATLPNRL